jgi:ribokinase
MTFPVAIDTDPGVDDAIALMLAMRSPEIEVELLTTVAGNVPVDVGTRNAKRLVALVDPNKWPVVAQGCAQPLNTRLTTATHVHGNDGLGGNASKFPVPRGLRAETNGVEQLVEFTRRHGAQGVIVALGPLTNIARAIQLAPKVMKTLGRLVIMGGAIRVHGNVTAVAEFNIFVDPEAGELVLGFGLDTLLVPLDVTRQVVLTETKIASLGKSRLSVAARQITLAGAKKFGGMPMHDSLAVAAAIDASLIGTEALNVVVETVGTRTRGMTIADLRAATSGKQTTIDVATSVNANAMLAMLERRVLSTTFARKPPHKTGRVAVVGSANIDLSFAVDSLPGAGETVLGDSMVQAFGGKGANQAVAAHRAGANVSLVARLGADGFADEYFEFLADEGVDSSASTRDKSARTGVATITISNSGENQIAVASGANRALTPRVLDTALQHISGSDVLVTQLEIPLATVKKALRTARTSNVTTVHNSAPAQPLDEQFLGLVDVLVCNEVEAEMLSAGRVKSIADANQASKRLREKGVANVIITLGSRGLVYLEAGSKKPRRIMAKRVKAVDTTGAGDTFVGYLAAALAEGMTLRPALELASLAAAQSVTRRGAIPSIPRRDSLRA